MLELIPELPAPTPGVAALLALELPDCPAALLPDAPGVVAEDGLLEPLDVPGRPELELEPDKDPLPNPVVALTPDWLEVPLLVWD